MKTIEKNDKTLRSIDCDTVCGKLLAGKPCSYCYVQTGRRNKWHAKKMVEETEYNGINMTKNMIDRLNACGGIRIFAFSDYKEEHDEKITQILSDCFAKGLMVKAITKRTEFVDKYHDHPAISVIHLSVDANGEGVDINVALKYREMYKKVLIRTVILRPEDLETLAEISDIVTFNHGNNGYYNFTRREDLRNELIEKYNLHGKVCCTTHKCETCPVKCGTV